MPYKYPLLLLVATVILTGCFQTAPKEEVRSQKKPPEQDRVLPVPAVNDNVNTDPTAIVPIAQDESLAIEDNKTANWQTYTNEEYSLSFKHDQVWTVSVEPHGSFNAKRIVVYPIDQPLGTPMFQAKDSIAVYPQGEWDAGLPIDAVRTTEELNIGGKQAIKNVFTGSASSVCFIVFPEAPADNWLAPQNEYKNGNRITCPQTKLTEEILNTFEFLES